jgi:hypothetical protein
MEAAILGGRDFALAYSAGVLEILIRSTALVALGMNQWKVVMTMIQSNQIGGYPEPNEVHWSSRFVVLAAPWRPARPVSLIRREVTSPGTVLSKMRPNNPKS